MTTPLNDDAWKLAIREAIVSFRWSNFGLDEVEDADKEYVDHLADRIIKFIEKAGPDR